MNGGVQPLAQKEIENLLGVGRGLSREGADAAGVDAVVAGALEASHGAPEVALAALRVVDGFGPV